MTLIRDFAAPVSLGDGCHAYRVSLDGRDIGWVFGVDGPP